MLKNISTSLSCWCQESFSYLRQAIEKTIVKTFVFKPWFWLLRYIGPDGLCYIRMAIGITILFLYTFNHRFLLMPLFILGVLSDLIDGPLARYLDQVTEEGKRLDANADKILIIIPLIIIGYGRLDRQLITWLLSIEAMLFLTANFLKPILREKYSIPLTTGSNGFGKTKMLIESCAISLLLIDFDSTRLQHVSQWLIFLAIIFGISSLIRHLAKMDAPVKPWKKIINPPNLITLSGIFLLIPAVFALTHQQWWGAGPLYAWIFISDWLDGWLARKLHQETAFGTALDPVRDFLARQSLIIWLMIILPPLLKVALAAIIITEIVIAVINVITAHQFKTVTLVKDWGKRRGFIHYLALAIVFLDRAGTMALDNSILLGLLFIMFVFSLLALVYYVKQREQFFKGVRYDD